MLDIPSARTAAALADAATRADRPAAARYSGPDRRRPTPAGHTAFGALLDELDHGVVLLCPDGEVTYMNHAAAMELEAGHPLRRVGRRLQARDPADAGRLQEALRNASQRRWRKLVFLSGDGETVGVSVVPLATPARADRRSVPEAASTLLVLGKRQVCESLSVQGFAASCQLTNAETRVLAALCAGSPPAQIADDIGVAISTVRTHIGTIRVKTGAPSIRALVARVARLPPLMSALRQSSATAPAESAVRANDRRDRLQ